MTDHPETAEAAQNLLANWQERGWLRALDAMLPTGFNRMYQESDGLVWLLLTLVSHQYGRGHACLNLTDLMADPDRVLGLPPEHEFRESYPDRPAHLLAGLTTETLVTRLTASGWVNTPAAPLQLTGGRLYLKRLYQAEAALYQALSQRLRPQPVPEDRLTELLTAVFHEAREEPDWQKLACALAAQRRFAIITGGPGTGKTTTVVRLLAVLNALAAQPLRIRLAAPTGKAASRLTESLKAARNKVPEALRVGLPEQVQTLHKLLGVQPYRRSFRHSADNPVAADVVVVDEASMVDLEMMHALITALPESCQLILLGDKDQLASVEAGSVLGDLCQGAEHGAYQPETLAQLAPYTTAELAPFGGAGSPVNQATVMLRTSHRFKADSGIGNLATAVNQGQAAVARACFKRYPDLSLLAVSAPEADSLRQAVVTGYRGYLRQVQAGPVGEQRVADWAHAVLAAQRQFQVLCALRQGPWGVQELNEQIARWLQQHGLLPRSRGWFHGRPVMVQRNSYGLGLMNGDIGVALQEPHSERLRVVFEAPDGTLHWVLPSRLSEVETVFAMTVHKSQGSEFQHTMLVLPDTQSPVLTRELVYTGITRAKEHFTLAVSDPELLTQSVRRRVLRSSGLTNWSNNATTTT